MSSINIDTSSVQWLVGKKLTKVIEANLRKKFGAVFFLNVGDIQVCTVVCVNVYVDKHQKIVSIIG